ncbi:hypothetical protein B0O99DRAFT_677560 [Bisporella sp. PMI_857]|nr:hypothetical protein B0O99DRAFT_677560 [Bisporella sp. PMI_857]
MSATTIRSASPIPPSEERRQQLRMQLTGEHEASEPDKQFSAQVEEERSRIWNTDPSTSWRELTFADLYTFKEEAREMSKPKRPKSDEEKRRIAERRVVREHEREASRPYHQFVYQVSKERERIQEESANGGSADIADINMRAYETVKNTWARRRIWKTGWGILPGMSWKHEEPLEEEAADGLIPVSGTALRNAQPSVNHEAANGFFAPLFEPLPPVESNHREASAAITVSQQRPPADIDSAGLENDDAEHPPSAPNSPGPRTGKQVLGSTKVLWPSRRKQSHKDGQPQPVASASLGSVHPSKASKAARKIKPGRQRRMNISQDVSSDGMLLSSGVDAAEPRLSPPPERVTPRRSKRIQPPVSSVAKDPAKTASTDPSKRAVRSKPERKVASNLTTRTPAKPRGVLKRQPAKTMQGKARKSEQLHTQQSILYLICRLVFMKLLQRLR